MSQTGYIIIAVSILLALLVTFIVSFVLYRRTPVPKGCEDIKASEEKCSGCSHVECHFYQDKEENK